MWLCFNPILASCSEVLEPVSFFGDKQGVEAQSVQEDFEINIKSLTFRTVDDIYEEISSILIGKGIKPNFQLELTKFASKKAYLIQKNVGA